VRRDGREWTVQWRISGTHFRTKLSARLFVSVNDVTSHDKFKSLSSTLHLQVPNITRGGHKVIMTHLDINSNSIWMLHKFESTVHSTVHGFKVQYQ
jgi:hypothetical protein